ncbi:MAG: ATP-binding protein [Candidatus Thermoplasmatota archaeon]|nr:ATP-binding protein [Candidatus Thermoplasmatota archaeon]MBU4144365.1 ATP-binding protein [Candidatus Thermoplasmatota archaeon]MBU4592837.1 ATP-binding protein [Candidatus Thermoplasmatota archaeon]
MLPHFVNRETELKFLEEIYRQQKFSLVAIYGRRRVGKTELIKRFMLDKKGCYILFTNENMRENIKFLKAGFASMLEKPYFKDLAVDNLYDIFRYLGDEIDSGEKYVISLDEFPFILEVNRGVLSTFQKIVDEVLKNTNIMLTITGSSMSMMENDVLGYRSPLYGRNLNIWKLQPFEFREICALLDDISIASETYFVFGNIPYYLSFYDEKISLPDNIKMNILTKGMNLYDEPLILLRQEFRESRTYKLLLKYISLGYRSIGKLCSVSGMDKSNISKYLDTLKETGLIEHVLPLGKKRGGIYEITDPFTDFWFRFVYPNRADLEMGNIDKVIEIFDKEKNVFFGHRFEYLIKHLLETKTFREFEDFTQIHRWWHKEREIDIVGINELGKEILFAECKWQDNVNAEKILLELKEKTTFVDWNRDKRKEHYAIFARSFKKRTEECCCFDLNDMARALTKNT